MPARTIIGDCRAVLPTLPAASVHCIVTSPPYFGLRDYGMAGQLGLEPTPDAYVAELVAVFRECRRVLRDDGTLWCNLGDSYAAAGGPGSGGNAQRMGRAYQQRNIRPKGDYAGIKPKDLIGIPWRVAFALQADGWYLRSDIIWSKSNPMPESVTDRPTKAHEYLFLLSKRSVYFYDADAIREPVTGNAHPGYVSNGFKTQAKADDPYVKAEAFHGYLPSERNRRSVWTVASQPFADAHFATFPPALIEPCIKAGCPEKCCGKCGAPWVRETDGATYYQGDDGTRDPKTNAVGNGHGGSGRGPKNNLGASIAKTLGFSSACVCNAGTTRGTVLDPFGGAGTTGLVADRLQRNAILIELNPDYAGMSDGRIADDRGGLLDLMEAR